MESKQDSVDSAVLQDDSGRAPTAPARTHTRGTIRTRLYRDGELIKEDFPPDEISDELTSAPRLHHLARPVRADSRAARHHRQGIRSAIPEAATPRSSPPLFRCLFPGRTGSSRTRRSCGSARTRRSRGSRRPARRRLRVSTTPNGDQRHDGADAAQSQRPRTPATNVHEVAFPSASQGRPATAGHLPSVPSSKPGLYQRTSLLVQTAPPSASRRPSDSHGPRRHRCHRPAGRRQHSAGGPVMPGALPLGWGPGYIMGGGLSS